MKYSYTSRALLQILLDIDRLYLTEEELIDDGFISLESLQYLLNNDKVFSEDAMSILHKFYECQMSLDQIEDRVCYNVREISDILKDSRLRLMSLRFSYVGYPILSDGMVEVEKLTAYALRDNTEFMTFFANETYYRTADLWLESGFSDRVPEEYHEELALKLGFTSEEKDPRFLKVLEDSGAIEQI